MASGNATVKAVLSGDTIVLVGKATDGPPPEITLTLNDIQCPKIARSPNQTDEPYAWQSREFLRKLCIGKPVSFRVTQMVPAINRTFGYAIMNGESLSQTVLSGGWAMLKEHRDSADEDISRELTAAFEDAKAQKRGLHAAESEAMKKSAVRQINWNMEADAFLKSLSSSSSPRSRRESAIVTVVFEHVRDGATFRCFVPSACAYVTIALAGATCPRVNGGKAGQTDDTSSEPEPFALQGKLFTELRVLNRELGVAIHSASTRSGSDGTLLGTILHPKGNITVELLKAGLARVADWNLAVLPRAEVVAVREAENEAKAARRGVWSSYVPPAPAPECRVFEARVVEVLTGDTLIVAENVDSDSYKETRITVSSVRVPRLGSGGKNASRPEPFALECKEFVRSCLIGQSVMVSIEYARKSETGQTRVYGSVYYGKPARVNSAVRPSQNIALELISRGLGFTVKHRGDECRAEAYDMMMVEEAEAARQCKGVHSAAATGKDSATSAALAGQVNDVSTDGKKAKAMFNVFQKDRVYRGVVEHVFTGSRFKITVPSENICFQLALSQVRCHNLPKKDDVVDPEDTAANCVATWAEAAKKFSRLNLLQRLVDVEIIDIDRNGIMLGKLYVAENESKQTRRNIGNAYAYTLVQEGLAWVDRYAQMRGGGEVETLVSAQNLCQENSAGLWAFKEAMPVDPTAETAEAGTEDAAAPSNDQLLLVAVSEIYDGSNFCVNIVSGASGKLADQQKLKEVEELMKQFSDDMEEGEVFEPRKNNVVACLHDDTSGGEGQAWLRAKIEDVVDGNANVLFIDYGHRATVPMSSLRRLKEDVAAIPAQALDCTLAIAKAPPLGSEYGVPSAKALNSLVWDKNCAMRILSAPSSGENKAEGQGRRPDRRQVSSNQTKYEVVLYALPEVVELEAQKETPVDDYINVNTMLVKNGFARISAQAAKSLRRKGSRRGGADVFGTELLEALEEAQDYAHREHLRIWTYGHPGDSDDEAEDRRRAAAVPVASGKA